MATAGSLHLGGALPSARGAPCRREGVNRQATRLSAKHDHARPSGAEARTSHRPARGAALQFRKGGSTAVHRLTYSSRFPAALKAIADQPAAAEEDEDEYEYDEDEDDEEDFEGLPPLEDFLKEHGEEDTLRAEGYEFVFDEEGRNRAVAYDIGEDEDEDGEQARPRGLPAELRYFDTAKICIKSGDGGDGIVAFRREKFVPNGGPAGGNGGTGGSVILVADKSLNSLRCFRRQVHFRATGGDRGGGSNMIGRGGKDIDVRVPPGTVVTGPDGEILAELVYDGQRTVLLEGGKGGRGNAAFKTGRNNAPQMAENGQEGIEMWVNLEFKVVADVGLVGCPNAGKSTLLSVVSAARPKIANYPFTTLVPNLGVCEQDFESTVFADIPGLLEGASEGVGLGMEFLRHCERCRMLVQVVDMDSPDPTGDFEAIKAELALYSTTLASRPTIVALNKIDSAGEYVDLMMEYFQGQNVEVFPISAVTGEGVKDLVRRVREVLKTLPEPEHLKAQRDAEERAKLGVVNKVTRKEAAEVVVPIPRGDIEQFHVEADLAVRRFYVTGTGIERFTQMTNWDYYESVKRFNRVLKLSGINSRLRKMGAVDGDAVVVGEHEFEYSSELDERDMYQRWVGQQDGNKMVQGSRHWPHAM